MPDVSTKIVSGPATGGNFERAAGDGGISGGGGGVRRDDSIETAMSALETAISLLGSSVAAGDIATANQNNTPSRFANNGKHQYHACNRAVQHAS